MDCFVFEKSISKTCSDFLTAHKVVKEELLVRKRCTVSFLTFIKVLRFVYSGFIILDNIYFLVLDRTERG